MVLFSNCNSQDKPVKPTSVDRYPSYAGQFYPADSVKLLASLKEMFAKAAPKSTDSVFAIISPHAGYIYSGVVAASAFNQLDANKEYKTIFVIGVSHHAWFDGACVYNKGNYITPLGTVEVDTALASQIVKTDKVFQCSTDYQINEHSIEVQLPFLQYHLKKKFKIVPILLGTDNPALCKKMAEVLRPYMNSENAFVISTDFSHYPKYADANANDKETVAAICKNSAAELIKVIGANENKKIPELLTSLCGYDAVLTFLYMTEKIKGATIKEIEYKNSGDATKDSSKVVGYWALAFHTNGKAVLPGDNAEFVLTAKDKSDLLNIARTTLNSFIKDKKIPLIDSSGFSETIRQNCGAFVTLKIKGELRGCIGMFMPGEPLYKVVQKMAISSSTQDYRFNAVTRDELDSITIEISVLSPLKKINSAEDFVLGKQGIYMKKGTATGTFLPQVATETGWTKEEFLGHCAKDKAGIGWEGWKTAELWVYTAVVFGEK